MNTTTKILLIMGIFVVLFVFAMIVTFWVKGAVPDTLIIYTLGAGGFEALMCAGIKAAKVIAGKHESNGEDDSTNAV